VSTCPKWTLRKRPPEDWVGRCVHDRGYGHKLGADRGDARRPPGDRSRPGWGAGEGALASSPRPGAGPSLMASMMERIWRSTWPSSARCRPASPSRPAMSRFSSAWYTGYELLHQLGRHQVALQALEGGLPPASMATRQRCRCWPDEDRHRTAPRSPA
jgi:hypothetical protein